MNTKNLLLNRGITISPLSIMIDFEYGMFNAIKDIFPNTQIRGCFFHFGQAIWRRVNNLGLKQLYNHDIGFQKVVGYISALPLIPLSEINSSWDLIKPLYNTRNTTVNLFFLYVEDTWINNTSVLFDRSIWSHFVYYEARTNNVAEGFNSKLSRRLNKAHPNIYEVLNILNRIQVTNEIELNGLILGNSPNIQKRKYRRAHAFIINSRGRYFSETLSILDLIKAMSKAIKLCIH